MDPVDKNYNINVFTENREKILRADDSCQEYILLYNEQLQHTLNIQNEEMNDLQQTMNELEMMSDRTEKSTIYMRGLLKNFVQLRNLEKKIHDFDKNESNYYKEEYKMTNEGIVEYVKSVKQVLIIYVFLNLTLMVFNIISVTMFISQCICLCSFIWCVQLTSPIQINLATNNYNLLKINKLINKLDTKPLALEYKGLKGEVVEIENSIDFLDEYIDGL